MQIYTRLPHNDAIVDNDNDDGELQQPIVEFAATSYAILEREQRVDIRVQRHGPLNVQVRFRWLYAFASLSLHVYATLKCE